MKQMRKPREVLHGPFPTWYVARTIEGSQSSPTSGQSSVLCLALKESCHQPAPRAAGTGLLSTVLPAPQGRPSHH